MSDPVAQAAAQIAADAAPETGLVGELKQVIHKAEDAIEHLIHPDSPGNDQAAATASSLLPNSAPTLIESSNVLAPMLESNLPSSGEPLQKPSDAVAVDLPNAGTGSPGSGESIFAAPAEPKIGLHDPAGDIRQHLANIKRHLSLRGFEVALVQDIHGELDAIEKYL